MDSKLTLKLNEGVIEKAKIYAKKQQTSLSRLIENYLFALTKEPQTEEETITPLVKSLSGIVELADDERHRSDYAEYLTTKYK
jgi:hypothetical protein